MSNNQTVSTKTTKARNLCQVSPDGNARLVLPMEVAAHLEKAKEGIATMTIEFAPSWGNLNPAEFQTGMALEDVCQKGLHSVELSEAAGRNLIVIGLTITDLGRRVTLADHTMDPEELLAVIGELLNQAKSIPTEIVVNIERALDSAPVGMIDETPQFGALWDLIKSWKRSQEYTARMGSEAPEIKS